MTLVSSPWVLRHSHNLHLRAGLQCKWGLGLTLSLTIEGGPGITAVVSGKSAVSYCWLSWHVLCGFSTKHNGQFSTKAVSLYPKPSFSIFRLASWFILQIVLHWYVLEDCLLRDCGSAWLCLCTSTSSCMKLPMAGWPVITVVICWNLYILWWRCVTDYSKHIEVVHGTVCCA